MKERKRDGDTNALRESVLNQSTSRCMHISEQEAHTERRVDPYTQIADNCRRSVLLTRGNRLHYIFLLLNYCYF